MLSGTRLVLQAPPSDRLLLDPLPRQQNGRTAPDIHIGRGKIVQAFVAALMVVVRHKGRNLDLQVAGQEVVLQQDAVLQRLMSALDPALRHRVIRG